MVDNKLLIFLAILVLGFILLTNRYTGKVVTYDNVYNEIYGDDSGIYGDTVKGAALETPYEPQLQGHCGALNSPEFIAKISETLKNLPRGYSNILMSDLKNCDEGYLTEPQKAVVDAILARYQMSVAGDVA